MLRTASRPLGGIARPAAASQIILRNYANAHVSEALAAGRRRAAKDQAKGDGEMMKMHNISRDQVRNHLSFLPGFFIPMPFSNIPKSPNKFFKYQYWRTRAKVYDWLAILSLRWQSKKTAFTKAALDIKRGKALAAGKALHARLGQAMAAGDRGELRVIAMPRLYDTLATTLSKRDKNARYTWEILRTHGARLAGHRCAMLPAPYPPNMVVEQAVIAIDTTQKLQRVDARTGEADPESVKVQRRVEYFGIHRSWNSKTNVADDWAVLGNTKETTLQDWEKWVEYEALQAQDNVNKKLRQAREGTL